MFEFTNDMTKDICNAFKCLDFGGTQIATIKWDFIKNVASVSINVSDIFKTKRYNSYSETPYFTQEYNRYRDRQNFRINLSYRFGKMDASLFKRKNAASEIDPMQ